MVQIDFSKVEILEGFWKDRQRINREVTLPAIKESYLQTKRFEATRCAYRKWKFWTKPPHVFFDSDVAKFIEAWSYHLSKQRDEDIESFIDGLIDNIASNQRDDGYYNAHFLVARKKDVFKHRSEHELYCLGHLIEGAIAYHNATGKNKLLGVVERYADYVEERFLKKKDTHFSCPGHPEIELALIKLFKHTGKKKYFEMAKYFIYVRGTKEGDKGLNKNPKSDNPWHNGEYAQDFLPLKEQRTAEGHSVRACYLYSGATDVAVIEKDVELIEALKAIYNNMVERKTYVTGGIGAKAWTEGFDKDFVLPNDKAYTESCAAIALIMFARRLQEYEKQAHYGDLIERVLYNGFLSGVSLSGDRFFYENPLEIDHAKRAMNVARYPVAERQKDFACSCCPPNVARLISSVGSLIFSRDESAVYIDQYISSTTNFERNGKQIKVSLETTFPKESSLKVNVYGGKGLSLKIRKPEWAEGVISSKEYYMEDGYLTFYLQENFELTLEFKVTPKVVKASDKVETNKGTYYVKYGPFIYCIESIDNGVVSECTISEGTTIIERKWEEYGAYSLKVNAYKKGEEATLNFVPYFTFANRGKSDMYVYVKGQK